MGYDDPGRNPVKPLLKIEHEFVLPSVCHIGRQFGFGVVLRREQVPDLPPLARRFPFLRLGGGPLRIRVVNSDPVPPGVQPDRRRDLVRPVDDRRPPPADATVASSGVKVMVPFGMG